MKKILFDKLEKIREKLSGRLLVSHEADLLSQKYKSNFYLNTLIEILKSYRVIEQAFSLTDEEDPSGLGVEMQWLTPEEQIEESFQYYPGILLNSEEYIPIGKCLQGSGDPYFLQITKEKALVVRVPHDAVIDEKYDYRSIEEICDFPELFKFITN